MTATIERPPEVASSGHGVEAASRLLPVAVSLVVGLGLWWLAAGRVLEYLPTPAEVAREFVDASTSAELYEAMRETLRRVVVTWLVAYATAITIGIAMARNWVVETLVHPLVFVGLALPGAVSILLSILVFGLGESTALIALWVAVTPFIVTFVYDGCRALDPQLFQMGDVYHFGAITRLRHVIVPQLAPALISGARFGFAMSWKLVVLVEALSTSNGIGERLEFFFSFNRPAAVIAWTFSFTVVMVLVELLVFRTISRRVFRWRPRAVT